MKNAIVFCSVAAALFVCAAHAEPKIIAGPITNPGNGHDYYLLAPDTWTASEAAAENLDGTLATIRNAGEQEWVYSKFAAFGGTNRNLWIGLHRIRQGGPFEWVTGEKIEYANWATGNPDNAGGVENCVLMYQPKDVQPGKWNDYADSAGAADPLCGVVEIMGKANPKTLTEKEKELIGTWYFNGDPDRTCWIAGTENQLFAIDHSGLSSRLVLSAPDVFFAPRWVQRAEVVKDNILWSKGNWWSRTPMGYK